MRYSHRIGSLLFFMAAAFATAAGHPVVAVFRPIFTD